MSNRHYYSSGRPAGHYNKRYYQKEEKNNEARINRYSSAPDMGDGRRRRFPGNHVLHAPGGALPGYKNNCGRDFILLTWNSIQNGLLKHKLFATWRICRSGFFQVQRSHGPVRCPWHSNRERSLQSAEQTMYC